MSVPDGSDPFAALGLPARAGLTDDDVRAAWRRLATATHPDRADGGDPARFAAAAAAYTVLRTRSGRGEALADLGGRAHRPGPRRPAGRRQAAPGERPGQSPPPGPPGHAVPSTPAAPASAPWRRNGDAGPATRPRPGPAAGGYPGGQRAAWGAWRAWVSRLGYRVRRGRPARLALRVLIAVAIGAGVAAVAGLRPATPALWVGLATWLLLTAQHDLAPPP